MKLELEELVEIAERLAEGKPWDSDEAELARRLAALLEEVRDA